MTSVTEMESNGSEFSPARERAAILAVALRCPQTTWTRQLSRHGYAGCGRTENHCCAALMTCSAA
jgi:hypothetical protein